MTSCLADSQLQKQTGQLGRHEFRYKGEACTKTADTRLLKLSMCFLRESWKHRCKHMPALRLVKPCLLKQCGLGVCQQRSRDCV